jgi:hypothetical protein
VLDPRGRPVPGLVVTAYPSAGFPRGYRVYAGEGRAGLLVSQTATDAQGQFELLGLARGSYAVHGRHGRAAHARPKPDELGTLLGTLEAPAGEPGQLTFAEPRLEVVVLNHDGTPADVEAATVPAGWNDHAEAARLEVFRLEALDAWLPHYHPRVPGRAVEGRATFPAEPGASYLVVWSQPGVALEEVRVQAGLDALTQVDIRLAPPAPRSRVTFHVLGPDGRPTGEEPAVEVVSLASGLQLASTIEVGLPSSNWFRDGNDPDGERWTTPLPPGNYRARVWIPTFLGCVVPHPFPRTPLRPVEREFELLAGEGLTLELWLGAAGHLDLEPLEPAPHLTPAEVDALVPEALVDAAVVESARVRHGGAFAVLVDDTGRRVPIEEFELGGGFGGLTLEIPWVVPGHTARGLSPLPPGDWTLLLERPGKSGAGRDVLLDRPVTIRAGEVTTVRW